MAIAGYDEKLGNKDQAVAAYWEILSLDPENKTAKNRIKAIAEEATANGRSKGAATP